MGKENESSSSRRLTASIRDRIRERHRNSASGGDSSGSGGDSSGSGDRTDTGTGTDSNGGSDSASANRIDIVDDAIGTLSSDGINNGGNRIDRTGAANSRRNSSSDSDTGETETELAANGVVREPRLDKFSEAVDVGQIITDTPKPKRSYVSKKKLDNDALLIPLRIAVDFIYSLPVHVGWGKHWELDSQECDALAVCFKDVLDSFPSHSSKAFIKAVEKWVPVLTLAMTMYGITIPRIKETQRLAREQKSNNENQPTEETRVRPFIN